MRWSATWTFLAREPGTLCVKIVINGKCEPIQGFFRGTEVWMESVFPTVGGFSPHDSLCTFELYVGTLKGKKVLGSDYRIHASSLSRAIRVCLFL